MTDKNFIQDLLEKVSQIRQATQDRDRASMEPYIKPDDEEIRPGVMRHKDSPSKKASYYLCQDCRCVDPVMFMVHDELWQSTGLTGMICPDCFEKRLGRRINLDDLRLNYMNSPIVYGYMMALKDLQHKEDVCE